MKTTLPKPWTYTFNIKDYENIFPVKLLGVWHFVMSALASQCVPLINKDHEIEMLKFQVWEREINGNVCWGKRYKWEENISQKQKSNKTHTQKYLIHKPCWKHSRIQSIEITKVHHAEKIRKMFERITGKINKSVNRNLIYIYMWRC